MRTSEPHVAVTVMPRGLAADIGLPLCASAIPCRGGYGGDAGPRGAEAGIR